VRRRSDAIALAALALIVTLLFADVIAGLNVFFLRDITHYYYPAKHVLRTIVMGGELPFWNPFFSAGQPLAANPEHEVFYPLTWLILLPSFREGFHLLIVAHVYIAVFSMYALLRSLSTRPLVAFTGALSYALGGCVLSCMNLLPYLFNMAWLPLICLYTRRFLLHWKRRDFALASLFYALQLLVGEPTTIFQTGILLGLFALSSGPRLRRLGAVALISLAAFAAGAVQIIPAIDHFRDSVRVRGLAYKDAAMWSTPPVRFLEAVNPHFLGYVRSDGERPYWSGDLYPEKQTPYFLSIYPGILVTVLVLGGVLARAAGWRLFLASMCCSLLLAAGNHTPLFDILFTAGIGKATRFPEKFLLMGAFALVVFAMLVLEKLMAGDTRLRKATLISAASLTFVAVSFYLFLQPLVRSTFLAKLVYFGQDNFSTDVVELARTSWLAAAGRAFAVLLLIAVMRRTHRNLWAVVLTLFVIMDLASTFEELVPRLPASFYDEPATASQFAPDKADYRIYHVPLSESEPKRAFLYPEPNLYWLLRNMFRPMIPAAYDFRTVLEGDYDRTDLLPTADFTNAMSQLAARNPHHWLETAAGMSNIRYIAEYKSLPELEHGAAREGRQFTPVRFLETSLNPRYYFASRVVTSTGVHDFVRLFSTQSFGPAVACVSRPAFAAAHGRVTRVIERANAVNLDVEADGKSLLVLSVTPHKYWSITVDDKTVKPFVVNLGYQGVMLEKGRHTVAMRYFNPVVMASGVFSFLAMGLLFVALRRG
jgi:hypothetical protein